MWTLPFEQGNYVIDGQTGACVPNTLEDVLTDLKVDLPTVELIQIGQVKTFQASVDISGDDRIIGLMRDAGSSMMRLDVAFTWAVVKVIEKLSLAFQKATLRVDT